MGFKHSWISFLLRKVTQNRWFHIAADLYVQFSFVKLLPFQQKNAK